MLICTTFCFWLSEILRPAYLKIHYKQVKAGTKQWWRRNERKTVWCKISWIIKTLKYHFRCRFRHSSITFSTTLFWQWPITSRRFHCQCHISLLFCQTRLRSSSYLIMRRSHPVKLCVETERIWAPGAGGAPSPKVKQARAVFFVKETVSAAEDTTVFAVGHGGVTSEGEAALTPRVTTRPAYRWK